MAQMKNMAKASKARPTLVPTGIKCQLEPHTYLELSARSSLPLNHWLILANSVGIIDADYYYSDNEGHIMVKLINKGYDVTRDRYNPNTLISKMLDRKQGESFVQGIFHECFGATNDNENTTMKIRNGGFDSTR